MAGSSASNAPTPPVRITDSGRHSPRSKDLASRTSSIDDLPFHPRPAVTAMAIPNARDTPPPPLPPPRRLDDLAEGQDPGWQYANGSSSNSTDRQVKPGSSLHGGSGYLRSPPPTHSDINMDHGSRDTLISSSGSPGAGDVSKSEGLDQAGRSPDQQSRDHKLHGEQHLGQRSLENSSQAYDKRLLSRIGGPRTPPRSSGSPATSAGAETSEAQSNGANGLKQLNSQLQPLAVPERRHSNTSDASRSRWQNGGQSSPNMGNLQSPSLDHALDPMQQIRRFNSSTTPTGRDENGPLTGGSHVGSYDHGMFEQDYEDNGMKDLNLQDARSEDKAASKAGTKRRANSPPGDTSLDPRLGGGAAEAWNRRQSHIGGNQDSPVARFHATQGSFPSNNSSYSGKNSSYPSSYGQSAASTATSYGSERLSPTAMQMAVDGQEHPGITRTVNPSPRGPTIIPHLRASTDGRSPQARTMAGDLPPASRHSGSPRMQHLFICECCPKKPRKFENAEELHAHEMEKQYVCQYCHNRFKNKNEAERHQNSLHLRRHSWSCAALITFEDAFHAHPTHPNLCDICGYCGEEFANPPNWDVRVEHLNHEHKFGECNHSKRFFRADHFRQHLKHSHAGKSGKWTNMLENACMRDEPPPQPIHAGHGNQLPGLSQMANMAPMAAMGHMNQMGPMGQMDQMNQPGVRPHSGEMREDR